METIKDDDFVVWQPDCATIVKGSTDEDRRIGGFCSTEHVDRQDEVVLQKGLDFDEFLAHGYFNDNHSQATAAVIGIPDSVAFKPGKGWHTEGALLKGFKRADEIWELAKSLEGTKRRLGFSIEGKVLERADNMIVKAKIRNVAITNCPVNTACTWSVLAKSFHPEMEKALSVGADRVASTGGRCLVPEDLAREPVNQTFGCPDDKCGKKFHSDSALRHHLIQHHKGKKVHKGFRSSQAYDAEQSIALLRTIRPHFSEATCRRIFEYACRKERE